MKYTCITCGHQTDSWPQSGDTVRCPECLHVNTIRKTENVSADTRLDLVWKQVEKRTGENTSRFNVRGPFGQYAPIPRPEV